PGARQQFVRPVLTDVVEGAERPVAIADDRDRHASDRRRNIAPWLREPLAVADPLPGAAEDRADIDIVQNGMWLTALLGLDRASIRRSVTRRRRDRACPLMFR